MADDADNNVVVVINDDDDDDTSNEDDDNDDYDDDDEELLRMDAEQLEEYEEMIEELGSFPDKVIINTLSMIADDYADSVAGAKSIYDMIRKRLLDAARRRRHRDANALLLPLVYVLDSILKNAKGTLYADLVQDDARRWMPAVYNSMRTEKEREKLERVWETWNEFQIFETSKWREMGECFKIEQTTTAVASSTATSDAASVGGSNTKLPSFFTETRSPGTLKQAHDWQELFDGGKNSSNKTTSSSSNQSHDSGWDAGQQTRTVCAFLGTAVQQQVADADEEEARYCTQDDAALGTVVQYLAAASATSKLVKAGLERLQDRQKKERQRRQRQEQQLPNKNRSSHHPRGMMMRLPPTVGVGPGRAGAIAAFAVNTANFTNDGIKPRNAAAIGLLYEVGLPFVSSADGRRFATQLELSNHLDALFQRRLLENKSGTITARTCTTSTAYCTFERGWFVSDLAWQREVDDGEEKQQQDETYGADKMDASDVNSAINRHEDEESMPADETRERCAVCGIKFKMFFHDDDGMYKYKSCREIAMIMHDDEEDAGAEHEESEEQVLVHVTCWKALGSPEALAAEQALQYT